MKKFLAIPIVVCIVIGMAGCGADSPINTSTDWYSTVSSTTVSSVAEENTSEADLEEKQVDLESGPAQIVSKMESAYNARNIEELLSCFEPERANAIKCVVDLFGTETRAFQNLLSLVLTYIDAYDDATWGTVKLTPVDYSIDDECGTLTYHVQLQNSNGEQKNFDETVPVISVNKDWYISLSQLDFLETEYGTIPVVDGLTESDVADGIYPYCEEIDRKKFYGFMNISGKIVIAPFFTETGSFSGNYYAVSKNGKWGIIDNKGNLIIDFIFNKIEEPSSEGFWKVYLYDKGWGYLNLITGESIECQYDDGGIFSNGIVPVQKNGYWGAVDANGKIVVDFIYDEMEGGSLFGEGSLRFKNNLIGVYINDAWGVIDSAGNYILPMTAEYEGRRYWISVIGNNFFALNIVPSGDHKTIIYRMDGTELLNTDLGRCVGYINGTAFIQGWNAVYGVDQNGNIIFSTDQLTDLSGNDEHWFDNFESDIFLDDRLDQFYNGKQWQHISDISFDNWKLIQLETHKQYISNSNRYKYNLINDLGELYFSNWHNWLVASKTNLYIVGGINTGESSEFITYVYNQSGEVLSQYDGSFSTFVGDNFICSADRKKVIILPTMEVEEYNSVKTLDSNDSAIIVSDGIFYGLRTRNGFAGQGLVYNRISYEEESHICTMELGANIEKYRLGPDGTANLIE